MDHQTGALLFRKFWAYYLDEFIGKNLQAMNFNIEFTLITVRVSIQQHDSKRLECHFSVRGLIWLSLVIWLHSLVGLKTLTTFWEDIRTRRHDLSGDT